MSDNVISIDSLPLEAYKPKKDSNSKKKDDPNQKILEIGSDVEISYCVKEDLKTLYENVIYAEGNFYKNKNSTHWEIIPDSELRSLTHQYDGAYFYTAKGEKSYVKLGKSRIDSILYELTFIMAKADFFCNPSLGINCMSGFIKFDQMGHATLEPHDPDHRCRHVLPGHWSPSHERFVLPKESLLHKLLYGSFEGDDDKEQKVQLFSEICASAALGYATKLKQPRAVILKGETAENGKSQILDILRGLLPLSAISTVTAMRMGDERHVLGLVGKLLNACDELSGSGAISSDGFKALVTGEPVSGRDVYKSRVEFRSTAQHIFATNTLPSFQGGMDRGVRRRLLVISFNRVIPKEERIEGIGQRIVKEESDLLLAWAVEGASRLINNHDFVIPSSSQQALEEWLLDADPVQAWLHACVEVSDHDQVSATRAYQHFREWAEKEGMSLLTLPSMKNFVGRVKANAPKGIMHKRTMHQRLFMGMFLKNMTHV